MNEQAKRLLMESFDRELTTEEFQWLNEQLANDPELQQEKILLTRIREQLRKFSPQFSPDFSENVMNSIISEKHFSTEAFLIAFRNIAVPILVAASILLLISVFTGGEVSFRSIFGFDSIEPNYLTDLLFLNY